MIFLGLFFSTLALWPAQMQADGDCLSNIEKLEKEGTPQGNPQLVQYLKSLTRKQMLQAAREYCRKYETEISETDWPVAVPAILVILSQYEDGGKIKDVDLSDLIGCVMDVNEGRFFRESLIVIVFDYYWSKGIIGESQRKIVIEKLLPLIFSKEQPWQIRLLISQRYKLILDDEYYSIIYSDDNVKEFKKNADKNKIRNLFNLIKNGDVKLKPNTQEKIGLFNEQVEQFKDKYMIVLKDTQESTEFKKRAPDIINSLDRIRITGQVATSRPATTNRAIMLP